MRAMLVSTATYPLWMPWRPIGLWLARLFLDYEPGIHWPQIQMQAGTTGINTIRIYNPIRQAMRLDPKGEFVRKWLPYMRRVPDLWLFEPWRMPTDVQKRYGVIVGKDIPMPLVDLDKAIREAKERIFPLRKRPEVEEMVRTIIQRHGSRPGMPSGRDAEGREPTFRRRRRPSPPSLPSLFCPPPRRKSRLLTHLPPLWRLLVFGKKGIPTQAKLFMILRPIGKIAIDQKRLKSS